MEKQTVSFKTTSSDANPNNVNEVSQQGNRQGAAGTSKFQDDVSPLLTDYDGHGGARAEQEPHDDPDKVVAIEQEIRHVPERAIQPPDFDNEMRESNQQILDDIQRQVGAQYQAPAQMLQIAVNFETARQLDPRLNALRNVDKHKAKKPKTSFAWSKEQDQQIVAMTMFHLSQGTDMSTIKPYRDMIDRSPHLRYIQDPSVIRRRLRTLSDPNNSATLEDYCGYSVATDDQQRDMAIAVAKTIRASCLDLRLVKRFKLEEFTRRRVVSSAPVQSHTDLQAPDEDDVQIIDHPAPQSVKRSKKVAMRTNKNART